MHGDIGTLLPEDRKEHVSNPNTRTAVRIGLDTTSGDKVRSGVLPMTTQEAYRAALTIIGKFFSAPDHRVRRVRYWGVCHRKHTCLAMATLEQLLADLDLSKFASKFHEEDIDLETAKRLSEEDLKELGLSMGARKKLHEALAATSPAAVVATSAKTPAPVKSPLPVARASPASAAAMPKPAAVSPLVRPKPAAATPVAKKAAASRPDAFRWKWNFGGKKWDDNSGCYYHNHLRLHNGVDPKLAIVGARGQDEDHAIAVFDIVSGKKLAALSRFSENRTSVFDCDIFQDVIVTTGDDSDSSNVACFWDVEGFAFKGEYRGVNERGLLSCALTSSASGALTLVANTDANRNEFMTYDVETASRCSRPLHINIGHTQCADSVRRDPANPGCFLACYPGGKMFYVDGYDRSGFHFA